MQTFTHPTIHSQMAAHRATASQGFTLIELLVVISIIGLLATMLLPAVMSVDIIANKAVDSNSMRQIVQTQKVNQAQSKQAWAFPRGNAQIINATSAQPQIDGSVGNANGIDVSNISLYTLAARLDIAPDLFNSVQTGETIVHKANYQRIAEATWTTANISAWTSPNASSLTESDIAFAIDWSAPKSSGSTRIVVAYRDPLLYDTEVGVVYGDGHAGTINYDEIKSTAINTMVTPLDASGTPLSGLVADDIYTETGDLTAAQLAEKRHLWIGRGSKYRTDLK